MHSGPTLKFLSMPDGEKIAYKATPSVSLNKNGLDKNKPTYIWCGGLKSDMEGGKAVYLHNWAIEQGYGFIRFDYFGHGASSGSLRMAGSAVGPPILSMSWIH